LDDKEKVTHLRVSPAKCHFTAGRCHLPQAHTAMNITPFYQEGAQGSHRAGGDDVQGFQSLIVVIFVAASCGHAAI